jgi:dipeptidase D
MKGSIRQLEPVALWNYFYDLTQIPRPSGFMAPVQAFMLEFGKSLGLTTLKDEAGNILIRKPATPGMENKPGVVLQAHLDMVPQKNSHIAHDFEKDPILTRVENGWVKATDTTLGADNGIGVAAIMAVMASKSIQHGPVEGLFTFDEETGMYGAFGLKPGFFKSKILINLDSEHEGNLFVGCAGGINVTAAFQYQKNVPVPKGDVAVRLSLAGLKGGHSGVDILLGRANANKLLFRFLKKAVKEYEARLASFQGGSLRNAIPREAYAVVTIPEENLPALEEGVNDYENLINEAFTGIENHLSFSIQQVDLPDSLIPEGIQDDVINAMEAVHDGVLRMIPEMPEVVETSSNLAIATSQEGLVTCQFLVRSASPFMKDNLVSMIESSLSLAGAKVTTSGDYPGWKPNLKSHVMDVMVSVHEQLFRVKPAVNVIHAGLECGIIQDGVGTMEMISFGPNISFPHSPDEKVEIASVERFWNYLSQVLKTI